MSRPEDRIRRVVERAVRSVPTEGVMERVARRKRSFAIRRRANAVLLSIVVIGGTVFGLSLLNTTFRPAASEKGFVGFVRFLRPCASHPNVSGGLEVFAVDVATGEERRITEAGTWPDGSLQSVDSPEFTPDGSRYVWVDHYRHNLYVTDVRTGQTTKLASSDELSVDTPGSDIVQLLAEPGIGRPRVSPDGTRVVFAAAGGVPIDSNSETQILEDTSSIYVVDISGTSPPVRLTTGHLPTWTNDGRIAFLRSTTEVTIQHVGNGTSINERPIGLEFHVADADGTHDERVYEAPADVQIGSADWSPDGTRVAAELTMHGNTDIYVLDLETQQPLRLTSDPADDTSPTWSPDGTFVAFHTGRYGNFSGHAEIAMIPADGGDVIRLTHDDCWQDTQPTWIDDPAVVASLPVWTPPPLPDLGEPSVANPDDILIGGSIEGVWDLYAVDASSGETKNLTADLAEQLSPAWSPDHTKIAFAASVGDQVNLDIYVMNADGTDVERLTEGPGGESRPAWSPDGTRIAYEADDGVWVMNADGSEPHHIAGTNCAGGCYPSLSPDGLSIVFAGGGAGLAITASDGSASRSLTANIDDFDPSWSPDGSSIAFTCGLDVCVIRPDGTGRETLTAGADDTSDRDADWSPDGTQIVFTSDRGPELGMRLWVMDADGGDPRLIDLVGPWPLDAINEPSW
jgi:Tol biopolymer transport system component